MKITKHWFIKSLSLRLLVNMLVVSVILALITTSVGIFMSFNRDVDDLHSRISFIEKNYLPVISDSVYHLDSEQLKLEIRSLINIEGIKYIEVKEKQGGLDFVISQGDPHVKNPITKVYPLTFESFGQKIQCGTLTLIASQEEIYQRFNTLIINNLIMNLIYTILIAVCYFFIIQHLVTKHLSKMAEFTAGFNLNLLDQPMVLNRQKNPEDELFQVVNAFNHMRERLIEDVEKLRLAEKNIATSLVEKEVLLRELYHRTKNNMQVICSLLALQKSHSKDPQAQDIFQVIENRIMAMALVHKNLYLSKNLSRLDLRDYVTDLAKQVLNSYQLIAQRVKLSFNIDSVQVIFDTAIPCGMILNELITNTLKHGFPDNREGEITIQIKALGNGEIEIYFKDNGVGMPPDFDISQSKSLGVQIIYNLGESQLQGKVSFENDQGTVCRVKFFNNTGESHS